MANVTAQIKLNIYVYFYFQTSPSLRTAEGEDSRLDTPQIA
jgi:hypothetical protein